MTVQSELSQLLDKVQGIGAGILTLFDIININKKTYPEEVRTFFQVMEVFGQNTEIHTRPDSERGSAERSTPFDNLKILRMKSLD